MKVVIRNNSFLGYIFFCFFINTYLFANLKEFSEVASEYAQNELAESRSSRKGLILLGIAQMANANNEQVLLLSIKLKRNIEINKSDKDYTKDYKKLILVIKDRIKFLETKSKSSKPLASYYKLLELFEGPKDEILMALDRLESSGFKVELNDFIPKNFHSLLSDQEDNQPQGQSSKGTDFIDPNDIDINASNSAKLAAYKGTWLLYHEMQSHTIKITDNSVIHIKSSYGKDPVYSKGNIDWQINKDGHLVIKQYSGRSGGFLDFKHAQIIIQRDKGIFVTKNMHL